MEILAILYGFFMKIRNFLYDYNIKKISKLEDVEIICIGNIVVGGAGKTPAVHYYVEKYMKQSKKVGILSRGYKGKREKDPFVVRDYNTIIGNERESGDEAYLHSLTFNTPVVVSKNRYLGAKCLKEKYNVDVIIMDDGYQHRKLYRDKNILLIDATNPFGNFKYLPIGRLRESLFEIKRADEIVISKSNYVNDRDLKEIMEKLEKYNVNNVKVNFATYIPKYFYNFLGLKIPLESIKGKNVLIFSSIANPKIFYNTIKNINPNNIENIDFEDHYCYEEKELEKIFQMGEDFDFILTTEKDMVKINKPVEKLYFLKMEFKIVEGERV